jgi:hypothetical protein
MASPADPFATLGLPPDADASAVRSARRRLALELHPDRGGDAERMQEINVAFEEAMAQIEEAGDAAPTGGSTPAEPSPSEEPEPGPAAPPDVEPSDGSPPWGPPRVEHDEPSFVIEALPAVAYEALLLVAMRMGDVLLDDPPYLLEARLDGPGECWCRLELLPEAGATTIMLTVTGIEGTVPPIEVVRDRWIHNLNLVGLLDP